MNKTALLFLGALLSAGSLTLVACGNDETGGTGGSNTTGTGGSSTTTGTGGSDTTTTTTTTTTTGTGGTGGGAALSCDDYCTQIMATCTGANQQYGSKETCMGACAAFPVGTAGEMSGNSLACRTYHVGAAATNSAEVHCNHAGPGGGDQDPTDANPGNCGEACESFCQIAQAACTGGNQQYADAAACMADCKTFPKSTDTFDTSDASKNDYNCRLYHLTAAITMPVPHCGHIKSASPVCTQ